jgi:quinol monooxygenase YgiN
MLLLLVAFKAKKGMADAFARALREHKLHEKTLAEPGCRKYDFFRSEDDPDLVLLLENWESEEALQTHMQGENLKTMQKLEKEYIEEVRPEKYVV